VVNRRAAPTWSAEEWNIATLVLLQRDGGRCVVCRRPLNNNMERHHRKRRRDGGDRFSNVIGLHTTCHSQVHAHPTDSRDNGWICPTWAQPDGWPILMDGRQWLLGDDGGKTPVE
jgi:hypothetical protein